jgi:adenylate cyclase
MAAARTLIEGLGAGLLTAALISGSALETLELGALNRLFELRGVRRPVAPIVIVTIDEDSFDELDLPWPFPRALHAELLEVLAEARPLVIGFDLLFPEPSARGRADDEALGRAVARAGNVVLGAATTVVAEPGYTKLDLNPPLPVIRRGAAAIAPLNLFVDPDGTLRRAPLRHRVGDEVLLGFDAQIHRQAAAAGLPAAPLPAGRDVLINFRGGPRTFAWVPYHRAVRREVAADVFRGKIVLVGPTSEVLQDIFSTPFARARAMPGVETHANVIETLVRGIALREVPWWASLVGALLAATLGAWLVVRLRAFRALLAAVLVWTALATWTVVAFAVWDVWLRAVGITLGLVLGYGSALVDNFIREQRERRRLSQFFSPAVLREIVRHRGDAPLGSGRRVLTVLFSDIRGFTSIAERLEPEQVVEVLREYLSEMTEVVFTHGGTVDKYIGDCIMALYNVPFGDPEHAANAIRTGLELQVRTRELSAQWEAKFGVTIRNGVGINTGEAVVGTIGSRQRREYTAIGDTVNLAFRLEGLTKDLGAPILISESTYAEVRGQFLTREMIDVTEIGGVTVRGKTHPVKIYAVLPADARRPRVALEAAATLTAAGAESPLRAQARDISETGMSLVGLPADWLQGSTIHIRCEGGALVKPIVAEGTIVWRHGDAAGVSFTALDPDSGPAVAEYLRRRARPS